MTRVSILEAGIKGIRPVGDNVLIIKDEEEGVTAGGIIIPEAHRGYRRRGWVLATGAGYRLLDGSIVRMPYLPGDYLFADRPFVRRDEGEDELYHNPTICIIKGDEPVGFIRRGDCKRSYVLPARYNEIIEKFGYAPGWKG